MGKNKKKKGKNKIGYFLAQKKDPCKPIFDRHFELKEMPTRGKIEYTNLFEGALAQEDIRFLNGQFEDIKGKTTKTARMISGAVNHLLGYISFLQFLHTEPKRTHRNFLHTSIHHYGAAASFYSYEKHLFEGYVGFDLANTIHHITNQFDLDEPISYIGGISNGGGLLNPEYGEIERKVEDGIIGSLIENQQLGLAFKVCIHTSLGLTKYSKIPKWEKTTNQYQDVAWKFAEHYMQNKGSEESFRVNLIMLNNYIRSIKNQKISEKWHELKEKY